MSKEQERMEESTEEVSKAVKIAVPEFVADKEDPFANDLLDRGSRVRLLCDFARSVSDHAVIAVDGGWGTGKSAFLGMCRAYLEQQEVRVAEFNAWTESCTADPVFNLASALSEVVEKDRRAKLLGAAQAIGVAAGKNLPFKIGEVVAYAADAISNDQAFPNGLPEYRDCVRRFKEALEQEACGADSPLIVLVDELDRCLPQQVVEYLGAVHNLLAVPGVVVVLGINLDETAKGLEAVYGSAYGSERYLQRFFDLRMSLASKMEGDDLSGLINHLRMQLGIEIEADASRGYIDGLLATTALATGGALRDLQRVAQALRWTMAAGLDSAKTGSVSSPERYAECVRAALALLILRHLDPEGYRLFTGAKVSTHSVMLRLHSHLLQAEPDSAHAAFAMTAYFDSLAGETGGDLVTEEQFHEVADLYSFQNRRDDYSRYARFRQQVGQHLGHTVVRVVLGAVEMTAS